MGIRAAWSALWTKESRAGPLMAIFGAGRPAPTPRQYDKLAKEGFQSNAIVFRCVNLIAESAAAIPWQLFRGRGDRRTELSEHPLLSLLSRPNPMQGGADFFQRVYAFRLLSGNSYVEAAAPQGGPNGGVPSELWALRPDKMQVIKGERGVPSGYVFSSGGQKVTWEVEELRGVSPILHSKSFHPLDDWYGMSPLEAAAFEVDQHNAAGQWNFALLKNGARPTGAFVFSPKGEEAPDVLSDSQFARLESQMDEKLMGKENAGRPLILEGGLDWRQISMSPVDLDWLKGRDVSARDIAIVYDVPPQLVGIEGSQTFANFEQARLSLYQDAVLPLVDCYKDDLNRWLVPMFGDDLELGFNEDEIPALWPLRQKKVEMVDRLVARGLIDRNEGRAMLGMDKRKEAGADQIYISSSEIPIDADLDVPDPEEDEARGMTAIPEGGMTPERAGDLVRLAYSADPSEREPSGTAA